MASSKCFRHLEARGGNAMPPHEFLGKDLASLQARRRLAGADDGQPLLFELIDHAGDQRRFRPDNRSGPRATASPSPRWPLFAKGRRERTPLPARCRHSRAHNRVPPSAGFHAASMPTRVPDHRTRVRVILIRWRTLFALTWFVNPLDAKIRGGSLTFDFAFELARAAFLHLPCKS